MVARTELDAAERKARLWERIACALATGEAPDAQETFASGDGTYTIAVYGFTRADGGAVLQTYRSAEDGIAALETSYFDAWSAYVDTLGYALNASAKIACERLRAKRNMLFQRERSGL